MIFPGFASVLAMLSTLPASLDRRQPSAVLWKDQLFAEVTAGRGAVYLYRGPFTPSVRAVRSPLEYDNGPVEYPGRDQAKLQIRDNRILLCADCPGYYIFGMQELPLLEDNAFGNRLRHLRQNPAGGSDPLDKLPEPERRSETWFRYHNIIQPYSADITHLLVPSHRPPDVRMEDEDEYWREVRYDVLIHGPKSVWLFHAYKDRFFLSVEPDCLTGWYWDFDAATPKKNLPKPPERQLRTGKLPADFTERFAAYTSDRRDYLVTVNGKVYMAVPKGKAEVEVSAVWNDPKRKIVGVVQDQAHDAVYGWGFVTTSSAPERFYVKFGPKPVAVPYKLTVPLWGDRSDAYLESYECARAFRTAKK